MIIDKLVQANSVQKVLDALNKRLTLDENLRAIEILISDTGLADVEYTITHKLGKTPRHYIYNLDKAGVLYDSRRDQWTSSVMYVKCNVANCKVYLTVL